MRGEESLLERAVLRDRDRIAARAHDGAGCEGVEGLRGRVLELRGDRRAGARELVERSRVGVRGAQMAGGEFRGGRGVVGIEDRDAIAERARGDREHPAELASADEAERRPWTDHRTSGSCIAATCSRSLSRYSASLRVSSPSDPASRLTANSAALAAPASPMAKVATGIPVGICTIE